MTFGSACPSGCSTAAAEEVAADLASAINENLFLSLMGVTATSAGNRIVIEGGDLDGVEGYNLYSGTLISLRYASCTSSVVWSV